MKIPPHRQGFTLTEVMIVTGLSTAILTGLISVFIGSSRFVRGILIEADLALRTRELRDRLLFQAIAPETTKSGNTIYGGLLSSQPNGYNGAVIKQAGSTWIVNVPSMTSADANAIPSFGRENLTLSLDDKGVCDLSHNNSTWLKPTGLPFGWKISDFIDSKHEGKGFIDVEQFTASKDALGGKNANYRISLRYSLGNSTRTERLHIPIFGMQQEYFEDELLHDYDTP